MADKLREENLQVSLLDIDDFVKKNNLPEITNPVIQQMMDYYLIHYLVSQENLVVLHLHILI